jgi:hypothetical protein
MIVLFLSVFFLTLLVTRIVAHKFHDMEGYGSGKERSRTVTGYLRRVTGFDWHHIHFGFLFLLFVAPLIYFYGFSKPFIIVLSVGLSWTLDQIVPLVDRKSNYFNRKCLSISIVSHLIVGIILGLIYLKRMT